MKKSLWGPPARQRKAGKYRLKDKTEAPLPVMGLRLSVQPPPAPRILDPSPPDGLSELLSRDPVGLQEQLQNGWNARDCSENLVVKDDGLVIWRKPRAQFSDAVRGLRGYSRGLHAWEIHWPSSQRGTHAMVGVATRKALLQTEGYTSLLGDNAESWGWNLSRMELCHRARRRPGEHYPAAWPSKAMDTLPDKVVLVLDMEEGRLGFVVDGEYLGTAFHGLKGQTLYPAVSAVWGQCEVRIRYIGHQKAEPRPLMQLCRRAVHEALGGHRTHEIESLPLPPPLTRYLQFR
ncbi:SPRY domain-containing SOCS box protein 2 [Ambystoma mexicanum]|uniref:SPRY domain-containing SOCS box protein 2 n=1 Tax=Ambystoma mexicanum TaxID=8296 RepID=UPI0037E717CF